MTALVDTPLDPLGFVGEELAARGALVECDGDRGYAILSHDLARTLQVRESITIATSPEPGQIGCALGSSLLDQLVADVRSTAYVANIAWMAEPPRLPHAERLAERIVVRNGVADVVGIAHASAVYLAGVFAWSLDVDDRYEGLALVAAHTGTSAEPDRATTDAFAALLAGHDDRYIDQPNSSGSAVAAGAIARRAATSIGPRIEEIGVSVARRREREHKRIDEYFGSMIAEARRRRGRIGRDAIDARVAALHAEHVAKLRDLEARYTLRIKLEPVAFAVIATRVAEIRVRLRRRKGEREMTLHVPPVASRPDALACAGCEATTRSALLCDDALHVLCESCVPEATGRPHCPACRTKHRR